MSKNSCKVIHKDSTVGEGAEPHLAVHSAKFPRLSITQKRSTKSTPTKNRISGCLAIMVFPGTRNHPTDSRHFTDNEGPRRREIAWRVGAECWLKRGGWFSISPPNRLQEFARSGKVASSKNPRAIYIHPNLSSNDKPSLRGSTNLIQMNSGILTGRIVAEGLVEGMRLSLALLWPTAPRASIVRELR
ncbi:hypothetical protein PSPO01_03450 [Paraphaeosphaeria sporulosa]